MLRKAIRAFADITSHKTVGIPKVIDKIVWVHVVDGDGAKHVIPGYEGESMMATLDKNKVYIPASCKGGDFYIPETEDPVDPLRYGPSCSECQIEVGEPWINYMKPMGIWEKDRLTKTPTGFMTKSSRLACCFVLQKWMSGIEIAIPYNYDQKMNLNIAYERGENRIFKD